MEHHSEWLTGVRIARLRSILLQIPSIPIQFSLQEAYRFLWKRCGGSLDEISKLTQILALLKLVRFNKEFLKRTPAGDKLVKALRQDETFLGLALIRAGYLYDQARILLETGKIDNAGALICSIRSARVTAPQLVAILETHVGVTVYPEFIIPASLVQELNSVWALLPPAAELPKWAAERKEVGNRAEMYTVQLERTMGSPSQIRWVARDSDSLGFDVEDVSGSPSRCIEVKGRRDSEIIFYLSEQEWEKARAIGDRYEIQFWGGIDLSIEPAIEYSLLRANGYPLTFRNPVAQIGTTLKSVAVKWRFSALQQSSSSDEDI